MGWVSDYSAILLMPTDKLTHKCTYSLLHLQRLHYVHSSNIFNWCKTNQSNHVEVELTFEILSNIQALINCDNTLMDDNLDNFNNSTRKKIYVIECIHYSRFWFLFMDFNLHSAKSRNIYIQRKWQSRHII